MKKNIFLLILLFFLGVSMGSGCAHYSADMNAVFARNIRDLEKARSSGKQMTVPLSRDDAFDKTIEILKNNDLTIYQRDRKKGYIVVMGLPKQVDTTRVGIFFESVENDQTKITLSSLSSTAVIRAASVIFGGF